MSSLRHMTIVLNPKELLNLCQVLASHDQLTIFTSMLFFKNEACRNSIAFEAVRVKIRYTSSYCLLEVVIFTSKFIPIPP